MMKLRQIIISLIFLTINHLGFTQIQDDVWTRIQPTPQEHSLYCVRQIPGTETIVTVGNGCTIMYSDDEGETWDITLNSAGLPNNTQFRSVNFIDEDNGYAADYFGRIIKTEDGGESWDLVYNQTHDSLRTDRVDIYLFDAETAIVVGWHQLILKTENGGESWITTLSPDGFFLNSIDFVNQDTGYIVGNPDSAIILRTYNGGDDWYSQPFIDGYTGNFFDIEFVSDSVGFINYNSSNYRGDDTTYIFKTTDKGVNWTLNYKVNSFLSIGELNVMDESNIISFAYNWGLSNIVTHNQGLSWEEIAGPFSGSWFSGNSILYTSEYIMSVGIYGRVYRTNDLVDWISLCAKNNIETITGVEFTSPEIGYSHFRFRGGGILTGKLYKTTDGGISWTGLDQGSYTTDFNFLSNDSGYVVKKHSGTVISTYKTTDGGINWIWMDDFITDDFNWLDLISVDYIDEEHGILAYTGKIYRTSQTGDYWQEIFVSHFEHLMTDIHMFTADTFLVATYDTWPINSPILIWSYDGGESLVLDTLDQSLNMPNSIYFKNRNTAFIPFEQGNTILKSTDGGLTWDFTTINDTSMSNYHSVYFPTDSIGYAVGSGPYTTMLKTIDGGDTWDPIDIPCSSGLSHVYFHDEWHGFVFGDGGIIMETFTGGVVSKKENPYLTSEPFFSISPNPSRDNVQIKLDEPIENVLIIEIYNINGERIIHNLKAGIIGKNDISINLTSLPPGLYFCRISNGNNVSTRKIIKL